MLLRSGNKYTPPVPITAPPSQQAQQPPPEPQMCGDCNRFWGNPEWDMQCSICSGYGDESKVSPYYGFDDPKYQTLLTIWVNDAIKNNARYIPILNAAAEQIDITMLKEIFTMMRSKQIFLTAEQAYPLLRNKGADTNEKSHLICQFIIDWWNMKKYPYNGTEMCYFGNFGDDPETKNFPPRLPNCSFIREIRIPYPK